MLGKYYYLIQIRLGFVNGSRCQSQVMHHFGYHVSLVSFILENT